MATTASPPAGATSGELVAWAFERINDHDLDALRQFWGPETVERFPTGTIEGTPAIAAYFKEFFAALPDAHMEVVKLVEDGDDVFVHWQLTATHSGAEFQGIAPTGKPIVLDGIDHFVVRDGLVASNFVVFDQMQFARAIGMLPPDGSRPDRAMKAAFNARQRLQARLRRV
jgi:predicted ester cyclase